ncbi:CD225/dispanin family protein [Stenotrophomonas sp. ATCM1_4]|uniref:CD225/dispanin family protein n=1 Tax=Stenotrophomonas capsici TaxID=3110230 RepID=A0ABU5V1U1_9GAMM|nr:MULTISPECIES: CD225/dispanin family protein [unclassified Stenotrophomonas]MBD9535656.1 CD225/dispanin family protein [Stenotrophomonas sp. STM01]MEA5667276.1 CD225/dispanin family protein [Stenotrophomonas sp. MH1]TDB27207.1 CD225/dispanin family protein [Stenotrophomonas sp. ATCM1_4]
MNTSSPAVSNNLVWAILSTLFCCLPLGIVSIIHAAKVNGLLAAGDIAGARDASEKAKKWAIYAAIAGIVVTILYFVLFTMLGLGGAMSGASSY